MWWDPARIKENRDWYKEADNAVATTTMLRVWYSPADEDDMVIQWNLQRGGSDLSSERNAMLKMNNVLGRNIDEANNTVGTVTSGMCTGSHGAHNGVTYIDRVLTDKRYADMVQNALNKEWQQVEKGVPCGLNTVSTDLEGNTFVAMKRMGQKMQGDWSLVAKQRLLPNTNILNLLDGARWMSPHSQDVSMMDPRLVLHSQQRRDLAIPTSIEFAERSSGKGKR